MRHFITGGSGFFGLHLLDAILSHGEEAVVFDRDALPGPYASNPKIRYVKGDVREKAALLEAMKECDVVHHNAAVLPISRSGSFFRDVNVGGTRNVLEAAQERDMKKVLVVSTSAIYGIPKSVPINEETPHTPLGQYGWSKEEAEGVCRDFRGTHDLDVSIVRPRTIVGTGRLGIFGILFDWIRRGKRVYIIGKGDNLFQFVSARDLADACVRMTRVPCKNEDFNIGTATFGTVRGDMEALITHAKTGARVQPVPAWIVRWALSALDLVRLSPLVDWHYKTPHKPFFFDITKAERVLGWKPKDTNIGALCDTYDWYLQHREEADKTVGTTHRKTVKQGLLKLLRAIS
jgi:nucleoside-diphosphate-sugar epimerase